ncbi:MAG: HNH endonuclease signature motif containing protein, partial [Acidimicrobiales bacterium]
HVDPWTLTFTTRLDHLARLCRHHHAAKTYDGWWLTGGPGGWHFDPPDPARGPTPDQVARQRKPLQAARPDLPPGPARGSTRGRARPDPLFDPGPDPFPP